MSSYKAYDEIRGEINTDHRYHLRIDHIGLFEVAELETSVSLEEHRYKHSINAYQHPVSSSVIGKNYRVAVIPVPQHGKHCCQNAEQHHSRAKGDKSFIQISFAVHNFYTVL